MQGTLSRAYAALVACTGARHLLCAPPQKMEQESMGGEDNGQNLEKLARRLEALERENRELREALGSVASEHQLETPQQELQATQAKEMTLASSKTVRGTWESAPIHESE
jgi:hypothetical protein